MKPRDPRAQRWADAAADERAAQLFQCMQRPGGDLEQVARIRKRLFSGSQVSPLPRLRRGWLPAFAVTAALILGLCVLYSLLHRRRESAPTAPAPSASAQLHATRSAPVILLQNPTETAEEITKSQRPERKKTALPIARPESDELINESRLIDLAIVRLHRHRDPIGTIYALDQHQRQFPAGTLRPESYLLRITALLALKRQGEALTLLDSQRLDALLPRSLELRVIRGELRAAAGRCDEATRDFTTTIAVARGSLLRRALAGQERCASAARGG